MAGLNENGGFDTPTWAEIITEMEGELQAAFNNPLFTVEDNENFGQLIKVLSERESRSWQAMEQVYRGWSREGAEGPFLDEIFALNGIFREGATAGTGDAVVETDSDADDNTLIEAGTLFQADNGVSYASQADTTVKNRVTGYLLDATDVPLATYNFVVKNRISGQSFSSSFTLNNTNVANRLVFLTNIRNFLQSVNTAETNIQLDEDNLTLYYGYDEAYDLQGLVETTNMSIIPSIGNRSTLVSSVATTTGFNNLSRGGITAMTPVPVGYVSVTNLNNFSNGTDIETDAAFNERAEQESSNPRSSTRTAIISGLLKNVIGVEKVSIDKAVVDDTLRITPIVVGGETKEIAEEIYKRQPITANFLGDISYTVNTADNKTEVIRFSRGETRQLSVRITYKTTTNSSLLDSEVEGIASNLSDLSDTWQLNEKVFNFSLLSEVSGALTFSKFSQLLVETKELGQPDSEYTSLDYQAPPTVVPDIISENISYRLL